LKSDTETVGDAHRFGISLSSADFCAWIDVRLTQHAIWSVHTTVSVWGSNLACSID